MSLMSREVIKKFKEVAKKKTISEYAESIQIERTRMFRLIHGAELKLSEYEKIQGFINQKLGHSVNWDHVMAEADKLRSRQQSQTHDFVDDDLATLLERKMRLNHYLKSA